MSTGPVIEQFSGTATVNLISRLAHRTEPPPRISAPHLTDVPGLPPITFGEFVQFRFVPEYVGARSRSVKSHFYATLKYVLTPERVTDAFNVDCNSARRSPRSDTHRPYMDSVCLEEITSEAIERLMSEYLRLGYSGQTVAHIRNALRTIFSFAATCGCYSGANPAKDVPLPEIARKEPHLLAFNDLKTLIPLMRYPEREIALITLMTGIPVTEVCGLQWKHVNLSNSTRMVDGDWVPPGTLAVRNQSYRGTFGPVCERRRKIVSVSGVLTSVLRQLLHRESFTDSEDFVLCSRNGTRINPDNIALRRLKPIGVTLEMPWLSWKVFRNSRASLAAQAGKLWSEQLAQFLRFK